MKRINDLGLTGKKLVIQGLLLIVIGIIVFFTGTWLPSLAVKLFLYTLLAQSIFDLILRLLGKGKATESLLLSLLKIVLFSILAGADAFSTLPIFLLAIFLGIYQLFTAGINFITYYLYKKDGVSPRNRFLFDGIWLLILGGLTLFASSTYLALQLYVMAGYIFIYGLTNLRDGLYFEESVENQSLKRHIRLPLPLFIAALIPRQTLQKINDGLSVDQAYRAEDLYNVQKETISPSVMEVFVHVSENGFGAIGHVDLSFHNIVYSFGSYDILSERLFGSIGDGVLFKADRESYIRFCNQEGKTMLGYKLVLNENQEAAVKNRLEEIENLVVPWQPSDQPVSKKEDGSMEPMYAYRMKEQIGAELFKFTSSNFKTYFVLSTNCVQLADSVIGQAGTDLLGIRGFIAPGTYQSYLDREFEKPNSFVVAKNIYYRN